MKIRVFLATNFWTVKTFIEVNLDFVCERIIPSRYLKLITGNIMYPTCNIDLIFICTLIVINLISMCTPYIVNWLGVSIL